MELIYLENKQNTPMVLRHDGLGDVTLQPGDKKILSLDYVNVHFGNPAARDRGKHKDRDDTYKRVCTNWGHYSGLESNEEWEARKPKFEVRTLEGERVWTVLEDPLGTKDIPDIDGDLGITDARFVNARISELTKQIERLTMVVAQNAGNEVADFSGVPRDHFTTNEQGDSRADEATARVQVAAAMEDLFDVPGPRPSEDIAADLLDGGETQAEANDILDEFGAIKPDLDTGMIPEPVATERPVVKDSPRTPRTGSKRVRSE